MPRLPRDLSGEALAALLKSLGYNQTRQSGSHIRLTARTGQGEHHITIPNHQSLKIGTLSNILKEIAEANNMDRDALMRKLFGR